MEFPNHAEMRAIQALLDDDPYRALLRSFSTGKDPKTGREYLARRRLTSLLYSVDVRDKPEYRKYIDDYSKESVLSYTPELAKAIVYAARDRYLVDTDLKTVVPMQPRSVWALDQLRVFPSLEDLAMTTGESRDTIHSALRKDRDRHQTSNFGLMALLYDRHYF